MPADDLTAILDVEKIKKNKQNKCAWQEVVLDRKKTKVPLRKEILTSWNQCLKSDIDPLKPPPPTILSKKELLNLREENNELIEVAKPILSMLEISVRGTGFIVTLTDKKGYVLEVQGDPDVFTMAQRNYYLPGCLRSSGHAGTNSISLSLETGKSIQLTGAEHYNINNHGWTCSSAPVKNHDGDILAAITFSGSFLKKHTHTLALVKAAAASIESQLREKELLEQMHRLNYMFKSIHNSVSDGIIAMNHQFKITHLNTAAINIIGMDNDSIIGKQFQDLISQDEKFISSLESGVQIATSEITFKTQRRRRSYICHVDSIFSKTSRHLGCIVTVIEPKKMVSIAKKIGGNYAKYDFSDIIGENPEFMRQIDMGKIAGRTDSRVLIMGESGTGKELFAQSIHNYNSKGPFVAISCAAIPRDLIESELFGYKGGAFTGARSKGMIGKFELANGGTLFLDEINGLPLEMQGKLLRVLQENEIMRLGDDHTIPIDIRVIAASNTNLLDEIEYGNFREDLYYRLNVIEIFIPPLRERDGDLFLLIDRILTRHSQKLGIPKPKLASQTLKRLKSYDFPGNVRELENLMERALLLAQGKTIKENHLRFPHQRATLSNKSKTKTVKHQYKDMVLSALDRCNGNASKAARELKIARSTLYRKMQEFGIKK